MADIFHKAGVREKIPTNSSISKHERNSHQEERPNQRPTEKTGKVSWQVHPGAPLHTCPLVPISQALGRPLFSPQGGF